MNNRYNTKKFDQIIREQEDEKKSREWLKEWEKTQAIKDPAEENDNGSEKSMWEIRLYKETGIRKEYVHLIVQAFTMMGLVKNPGICSHCKRINEYITGHHESYFRPLDLTWLCQSCHRKRHVELAKKSEDPSLLFCQGILESPSRESYLNRFRQFYSQVAQLSSELFDADFLASGSIDENNVKLLLSYTDSMQHNDQDTHGE